MVLCQILGHHSPPPAPSLVASWAASRAKPLNKQSQEHSKALLMSLWLFADATDMLGALFFNSLSTPQLALQTPRMAEQSASIQCQFSHYKISQYSSSFKCNEISTCHFFQWYMLNSPKTNYSKTILLWSISRMCLPCTHLIKPIPSLSKGGVSRIKGILPFGYCTVNSNVHCKWYFNFNEARVLMRQILHVEPRGLIEDFEGAGM